MIQVCMEIMYVEFIYVIMTCMGYRKNEKT